MGQNRGTQYRLHVAGDGLIWYAIDQHMPIPVGMSVGTFIENNPLTENDEVVMSGCRNNSILLVELYKLRTQNKFKSLKVCSPMACKGDKRRQDPKIVLMDLMQLKGVAGSMGGWHEVHETDFYAHLLAAQTDEEGALKVYKMHPIRPYLSFIPHLNEVKCAQLIGGLIDPRWYVDPDEPESHARIQGYLGLNPRTQYAASVDSQAKVFALERCKLVQDAWKGDVPTEAQMTQPGYFLWRIFDQEGKGYMADLRASQVFVSYVRETWLHAIYESRGGGSKDGIFAPDYFFKTPEEVNGYKAFMRKENEVSP